MPTVTDAKIMRHTLVSAFIALALFAMTGSVAAQVNTNGSFEDSDTGAVDINTDTPGWNLNIAGDADAAFEIVEGEAQDGEKSLKVTVNAIGTNAWDIEASNELFPVTQGATYRYSIWARAETAGAVATFSVGAPPTTYTEYGASRELALTTEWQEITFSFTPSVDTTVARGPVHFSYAANPGNTIYIDNLSIVDPNAGAVAVVFEAEDGEIGSELATVTDDGAGVTYIETTTEYNETTGATDYPGANRTVTYEVTFDAPGWYDFYANVYVGPDGFDDDSFFYADTLDTMLDPGMAEGWFRANGLATAGYTGDDEYVTGSGAAGTQEWKWVNLTEASGDIAPLDSFYVAPDNLTLSFQIGARENGLRIDRFAFGRSDLFYTVANLDNGEPGATEVGGPEIVLPENPIAAGKPKFIGNIYSGNQVENFEYYWNYVIAENAGKWGSVEQTRDVMSWGGLDASYALAQEIAEENDIPYNFHVLMWGAQQPAWINDLEPAEQIEEIREWVGLVANRYPDMDVVQVMNEPLDGHNPPDGQNGRANYKAALDAMEDHGTDWDWVINAFQIARDSFPDTRLMLNDFNILSNPTSARTYVNIIELLQERDLIDVIGVQGHAFSTGNANTIKTVLDILAETGLPIQVTEMDVDGNPNNSDFVTETQSDQTQLASMQRIFPVVWTHPSVEGVTFWGWRPGLWRNDQEAFLVRSTGEERPALDWLQTYVADTAIGGVANEAGPSTDGIRLMGNRPNPFNGSTRIEYVLDDLTEVQLDVFDAVGRRVATLVEDFVPAGTHDVVFDGTGLPSGVYLYRLSTGSSVQTGQMVLAR